MMKYTLNTCNAEYEKDPNIKKVDIQALKEWQQKQAHLPDVSEYMLQQFYHCCDYSLDQTKNLIELHYTFKNEAPEFFTGRDFDPPRYKHTYFQIIYFFEFGTLPNGHRLFYTSLRDPDPTKYNFTAATGMFFKILMTVQFEQGTCPGYEIVYNFEGAVPGHLATASLSGLRKAITYVQDAIPLKVQKIHLINTTPLISKIMMLIKPFMKKELYNTIRMHSNMDSLYKEVPRELLPKDFTGDLSYTRDELNEMMNDKVEALHEVVLKELKLKSDESKRVRRSALEEHGVTPLKGSFKQLVLD